jgi:hypothetical protein
MCVAMLTAVPPEERPWHPLDQRVFVILAVGGMAGAIAAIRAKLR